MKGGSAQKDRLQKEQHKVSEDNSFSASWNCCYTFLNFNRRIPGNTNLDIPFGFYSLAVDVQAWSRC